MPTYDPNYPNFCEFPKWIDNVLVHSREEEREIATATAEAEHMAQREKASRPPQNPSRDTSDYRGAKPLAELGISHDQSAWAQKLAAAVPELDFETAVKAPGRASTTGIITAAAPPKPTTRSIIAAHTEAAAPEPARPLSAAATRMARMRDRQRNDRRIITLDVTAMQIATLVQAGVLDAFRQDDAAEVAFAVGRMLDHAARNSVTPTPAP